MEYLKACTTNIHVSESTSQINGFLYKSEKNELQREERWKLMRTTLRDLRQRNILCTTSVDGLWIFRTDVLDLENFLGPDHSDFALADTIKLNAARSDRNAAAKRIHEVFLEAVEAAIAFKLAGQPGMLHVGFWTWVCFDEVDSDMTTQEAILIKLRANMTASGALYLLSETATANISFYSRHKSVAADDVLLAPQGLLVKRVPQDPRPDGDDAAWKAYVRLHLESEGILIPEDAEWQIVQLNERMQNTYVHWPSDMCLLRGTMFKTNPLELCEDKDWHSWFGNAKETSFQDLFAMADEWFKGAAEREQSAREIAHQQQEINAPSDSQTQSFGTAEATGISDANIVTSSPFNQRNNDAQMAVAGIYPTPPDGLTQGTITTQLTADSSQSTMQVDQPSSSIDLALGDEVLQQHGRASIGSEFQHGFELQSEDLFGDRGEEMELGDNAVDDADFSFFDEPDDDGAPGDPLDADMLEAPNMEREPKGLEMPVAEIGESLENAVNERPEQVANDVKIIQPPLPHSEVDVDPSREINVAVTPDAELLPEAKAAIKLEKPLGPFGIRERLLPPPVPASVAQIDPGQLSEQRRGSSFAPVKFRDGFNLGPKYVSSDLVMAESYQGSTGISPPNIGLPKRKKTRQIQKSRQPRHSADIDESESEEDSSESSSPSERDVNLPPKLPWDTRKRKRYQDLDPGAPFSGIFESTWSENHVDDTTDLSIPRHQLLDLLESCCIQYKSVEGTLSIARKIFREGPFDQFSQNPQKELLIEDQLPRLEASFELSKQDLIYIAQIIGEQAVSTFDKEYSAESAYARGDAEIQAGNTHSISTSVNKVLRFIFPDLEHCDLSHVALTREPLNRPTIPPKQQPGQPRPPQRSDSTMIGPDYFAIAPPYVKIQRGTDNWEMLPTCLSFWETLGLGPAGGVKNVRAFCVFPANDDLEQLMEQFMVDLGTAYESCKLGSHLHRRRDASAEQKIGSYENGMAPVELGDAHSLEEALKAYAATCVDLGKALAQVGQLEAGRNLVVYLLNPFPGSRAAQLLCACFWMLFKAFRENVTKLHRSRGGDVVLQLLPIQSIASFDAVIVHQAKDMAILAREVYDRCPPPPSRTSQSASVLPIVVAPTVELASPVPKRIGFQLSADPPSDLLHEGSILHLAYARSSDRQWLTASWIDNFGQHFASTSYCLRGRSFADVAADVWERTREILAARQVMWRVFVVTDTKMEKSISQCWRALTAKPRQQPLCVTLVTVQINPALQLSSPIPVSENAMSSSSGQDSNFLTPASTPQGTTFTSSPDVSSHLNAPPTPAPSESAATMAENDIDAHLADLTDDSWAMLLSPKLSPLLSNEGLANGVLLKRGRVDAYGGNLPSLGVSVLWTIQIKPGGNVDEGSVRQAELTLREVLRIYRNLTVLTRARGLDHGNTMVAPLHLATAMRSAAKLEGMLSSP